MVSSAIGENRSPGVHTVEQFIQDWVRLLNRAGYLTGGDDDAIFLLTPLVEALADSLGQRSFAPATAQRIGAQLAETGSRGRTLLRDTMRLVRARASELFPGADPNRVDEVLAEVAAGYADGMCQRTQLEQQTLLAAAVDARRSTESALRVSEERFHHQTYHDELTRLPNRALMVEQLGRAFGEGSPVDRVGLCHLDLDGFRALNATLGHQVGDQLLLAVAGRLRLLSKGHLLTRAGADEFTIVVPDPESADELIALAEHVLAGLAAPFAIGQRRLTISASMGLASQAVTDTTPAELQRRADTARSWAKAAGGGRWAMFDPRRDRAESVRFALATSIPAAVDREEFRLHYQPLVRMDTGELIGAEALVRWRHPEHGLLGPSKFIELSESNGSIVALGHWVLARACRQGRTWCDQLGSAAPYVSVNVAPRQLAEPDWLDQVSLVLADTGLPPGQLQLEITERAVLIDETAASGTLHTLRDMGVRLAIDDFGTGYSSLSYLRKLPVHGLKIDGSFIRGLREASADDCKDSTIIAALIGMAHALDLEVTAEWVETASQAHRLAALGCDIGQGNWYGNPVCAGQLDLLLRGPLAG